MLTFSQAVTFTPPTAEPVATISKPTSPEPRTSTTYTETQTSVENKQTSVGAAESLKQHADEAASLEDWVASTVPAPPIETTLTTDTLESATNRRVDEVEDPLACKHSSLFFAAAAVVIVICRMHVTDLEPM